MDVKALFDDDEAVSPVIGVILMVAITVILAAVIATFVLGLGDQISNTAPQASFSFDYTEDESDGDTLQVTHNGGETISPNEVKGAVSGARDADSSVSYVGDLFAASSYSDVNAGTSDTIDKTLFEDDSGSEPGTLDLSAATVRVTYQPAAGGNSATLGRWDGPDA
ncbi:type IV pilin [Halomicrobium sp. LC1Hm]|uniref:type IV pilin n=1 Tax=Halomicrobium sp. LC1Hm TaxID=2610902 RepID=UPI0012984141|nr:type IV pilin N-terminal domain-containing protein [Halomicrobium sp. LC1Hm]QGA83249.1 Pilin/Flagellin, FlaG/FlaF family [Halomicrobium sp. LC1Hm]